MPSFATLKRNHYSSGLYSPDYKSASDVYSEIGYDINELMKQNQDYQNTCAVRMSLAFLKSNAPFGAPVSRLQIKAGSYKGRFVATGAKTLADELRKKTVLGEPLTGERAKKAMQTKKGIVLFHGIPGYGGGHIDLIEPVNACHSSCHFNPEPKEIWFWPLN